MRSTVQVKRNLMVGFSLWLSFPVGTSASFYGVSDVSELLCGPIPSLETEAVPWKRKGEGEGKPWKDKRQGLQGIRTRVGHPQRKDCGDQKAWGAVGKKEA